MALSTDVPTTIQQYRANIARFLRTTSEEVCALAQQIVRAQAQHDLQLFLRAKRAAEASVQLRRSDADMRR